MIYSYCCSLLFTDVEKTGLNGRQKQQNGPKSVHFVATFSTFHSSEVVLASDSVWNLNWKHVFVYTWVFFPTLFVDSCK